MLRKRILCTAIAAGALSFGAQADGLYLGGSLSYNDMDDVDTNGRFTRDFITGGPVNVLLERGTRVRWNTDVDSGWGVNLALGYQVDAFRFEVEYAYAEHDVDSHGNVRVGGVGNIDDLDASVLIEGLDTELGATVGEVVRDGKGEFSTDYLFFNAFYDWDTGSQWQPYIGVGAGNAWVDVDYKPSNVRIIDDDDSVFAWQLMGGINYLCSDELTFFGGLRWRETDDVEVRSSLLPANFDVQTESWLLEGGVRWHF
ncbi:hypothetical protein AWR36_008600 [Microbulbifer flavimaris]|uniref:Msp4/OMP-like domain-containing protein n=1 Tax=Microbulbifer flavimaris TaxID=1781068 RepID=A0ABX4I0V7_9GAMM|nr:MULTISPECIES: outer membrane beta-barrel protein [Microbulbifer]KUJ83865.1 hypothetical protein AVO43_08570 [Microbulbifer sp. ZGT114]PCO06042.1 hypothetical protein AWR36_008600 [Microbulbifer flavimaris]